MCTLTVTLTSAMNRLLLSTERYGDPLEDEFTDGMLRSATKAAEKKQTHTRKWPSRWASPIVLWSMCLAMHAALVTAHIILLAVWKFHLEHAVVVQIGREASILAVVVDMTLQAFAIIYLAGLVYITQRLAREADFARRQTATATHDKTAAWSGLGAAFMSLWNQASVASSVWGVTSIALYLVCSAVVKTSTPALFSVVPFNTTVRAHVSTTLGSPYLTVPVNDPGMSHLASTMLPLLSRLRRFPTLGLYGNALYDVLDDNSGVGRALVNITTVNVTCGTIDAEFQSSYTANYMATNSSEWFFNSSDISMSTGLMAPNVLRFSPTLYPVKNAQNITLLSSVNFTDSEGLTGRSVPLKPPMTPPLVPPYPDDPSPDTPNATILYSLQAIVCSLTVDTATAYVDARNKTLLDPPKPKTISSWRPLQAKTPSTEPLFSQWNSLLQDPSTSSHNASSSYLCVNGAFACSYLSYVQEYVMDQLRMTPALDPYYPFSSADVKLHDLENALANVTAALFWSAAHTATSVADSRTLVGLTTVTQPALAARLQLNIVPIAIGLTAATLMLLLSLILLGSTRQPASAIGSAGVLEMLWLAGARGDVRERLARVQEPSGLALRKAGMFDVRMAGEDAANAFAWWENESADSE